MLIGVLIASVQANTVANQRVLQDSEGRVQFPPLLLENLMRIEALWIMISINYNYRISTMDSLQKSTRNNSYRDDLEHTVDS